jgi:formate dehydrogenase subunit beta
LISQRLREAIAGVFSEVDVALAYQQGFDKLHATPCFMTMPEEINKLIWNPLCVHNLTSYLPSLKKKKVAVVVKGCDSRTIVQFMQEGLINRENVVIIGIPCNGVISVNIKRRENVIAVGCLP